MRLKSYFTESVQEAMDQARADLGPDAMLISSQPTEASVASLGRLEVVFGWEPAAAAPAKATVPATPPATAPADAVLRELAELRRQMDTLREGLLHSNAAPGAEEEAPELARLSRRLEAAGFSTPLAQEISANVLRRGRATEAAGPFANDLLNALLEEEIANRFSVAPTLGQPGETNSQVMLVGPPGSGKTATLVKMALRYGLKAKRPVKLLSLDTLRVGGWEQLCRYARIGSIEFTALHNTLALEMTVGAKSAPGLQLIDTRIFKSETLEMEQLARTVCQLPVEVHLVLPAHLSADAARRTCERYSVFQPAKLVITNMDAVESKAAALESAMRAGLPLSFLCAGQQIPEDIEQASKTKLLFGLLPAHQAFTTAA